MTLSSSSLPSHCEYCYQAMAAIDKDEPDKKFWLHTRSGLGVHCHTYTVLFTIFVCVCSHRYHRHRNCSFNTISFPFSSLSPLRCSLSAPLSKSLHLNCLLCSGLRRLKMGGREAANCLFTSWLVHYKVHTTKHIIHELLDVQIACLPTDQCFAVPVSRWPTHTTNDKYKYHAHHVHCTVNIVTIIQFRKMNIIFMMCIEQSPTHQIMPSSNYLSSQTKWNNVLEYASHNVCFTETTTVNKVCPIREDINWRKKRFLSGIARIMGGGSTHARIFWPSF